MFICVAVYYFECCTHNYRKYWQNNTDNNLSLTATPRHKSTVLAIQPTVLYSTTVLQYYCTILYYTQWWSCIGNGLPPTGLPCLVYLFMAIFKTLKEKPQIALQAFGFPLLQLNIWDKLAMSFKGFWDWHSNTNKLSKLKTWNAFF